MNTLRGVHLGLAIDLHVLEETVSLGPDLASVVPQQESRPYALTQINALAPNRHRVCAGFLPLIPELGPEL